jgi:hypothetical protein
MPLTKEQILAANDRSTKEVAVPEWGDTVLLRVMSGTERESFEREWQSTEDKLLPQYRLKMLRRCLCDADGAPLFSDAELSALGEKSALVIERLFRECMRMNGFEAGNLEDAAKN